MRPQSRRGCLSLVAALALLLQLLPWSGGLFMTTQEAARILGIQAGASAKAIRDAKRARLKKCHPDIAGDDGRQLREVLQAVEILENPHTASDAGRPAARARWASPSPRTYAPPAKPQTSAYYGANGVKEQWYQALCNIRLRNQPDTASVPNGKMLRQGEVVKVAEVRTAGAQTYLKMAGPSGQIAGGGWVFTMGVAGRWKDQPILTPSYPPGKPATGKYEAMCDIRVRRFPDEDSAAVAGIKNGEMFDVCEELMMASPYVSQLLKQKYLKIPGKGWIFCTGISGPWIGKTIVRKAAMWS